MKVLVTGNKGFVGKEVEKRLLQDGREVAGYDLLDGQDILDPRQIAEKARGCGAIVHLAAIESESAQDVYRTNVVGTINVLNAAVSLRIGKLVVMSSVDSLGIFQGEGAPEYLPIDDKYPCRPQRPYSISKLIAEQVCAQYSGQYGLSISCIRAPGVWDEETYDEIAGKRKENPEYEWSPYWEYGAFIDIRDLSGAISMILGKGGPGYDCFLVAADDITTSGMTSLELVRKLHPGLQWKGGNEYAEFPNKSIINCDTIKKKIGWKPEYSWERFSRTAN